MDVTVDGKLLKSALTTIRSLPGIQDLTVLLRTEPGRLVLEAGTGGNFITLRILADVADGEGKVAIDGEALSGLVLPTVAGKGKKKNADGSAPPEPTLRLKSQGGAKLAFSSGRLSGTTAQYQDSRMTAIDAHRPSAPLPLTARLSVEGLLEALSMTQIHPAIDSPGHGTRLHMVDGLVQLSCTDVFRAAYFESNIDGCSGDLDLFANTDFLIALFKYAGTDVVQVGVKTGLMRLQNENFDAYMPLLQSKPDTVAPFILGLPAKLKAAIGSVRLPTADLRECLRSASSIVGEKGYESRLHMERRGAELSITAESSRGSATTTHDVLAPDREAPDAKFKVALSVRYLEELLKIFPGDIVDIYVWPNLVQLEQPGGAYSSVLPTVVA